MALRVAVVAPERVVALALASALPPDLEPSGELQAAWEAEQSALERGDIEAAVGAVVDARALADAPAALRERVARMQRRAFEVQAAAGSVTEAQDPVEAFRELLVDFLREAAPRDAQRGCQSRRA